MTRKIHLRTTIIIVMNVSLSLSFLLLPFVPLLEENFDLDVGGNIIITKNSF